MPNADTTDRGGISPHELKEMLKIASIEKFGVGGYGLTLASSVKSSTIISHAMTQYANAEVRKYLKELLTHWEYCKDASGLTKAVNIEYIQSLLKSIK